MRYRALLLFFALLSIHSLSARERGDTLYSYLSEVMTNKAHYTEIKEQRIEETKKMLNTPNITHNQRYDINFTLYNEYKTFIADSAICYLKQNLELAKMMGDQNRIAETHLALTGIYSIAGLYVEALDELKEVNKDELASWLLPEYYGVNNHLYNFYHSLSDEYNSEYKEKEWLYRDSLLSVLDPQSHHYKIVYAEKLKDNGELNEAETILRELIEASQEQDHEKAVLAYALSMVYKNMGKREMQKRYLTLSAICDIENAIKENASCQVLANLLYEEGDITNAYRCIQSSLEDAIFCNSRLRTFEVTKILPIIDDAYQESILQKKRSLTIFLIAISILSLFLVAAVVYVYKQMRRIAGMQKELHSVNSRLKEINSQLQESNTKLSSMNSELTDANQLKETYISHFLDQCSSYITKLEKYQRMLNKRVVERKLDELARMLRSTDMIDEERRELYKNFDNTFLHLYPNFIRELNKLLVKEEHYDPSITELNSELRILALMRLGISDSSKIADFLNYSPTTIYNYRTRMRNRAISRDDFEAMVCRIGLISD